MAHTTYNRSFALSLVESFGSLRSRLAEAAAQRRVYKTTMAELGQLSNRELADLGISRSDIRTVSWDAAYRK